ncbi:subtilase-type protease inhibitor [Streptomyces chryseus]|uniref:Probable subtilase-type protease inhibitor n=1 Tax=Streptomyces chryseus TaxID=68186 RepID=A0ABQ3DLL2_9ACTN|nr:subtilase-type protease inhibitor [Streptomyces chryseus]GGX09985.1 subtilase-type protease inhibitor [Streptomyces chryseus]GHB06451.1 subtilase-type protease inhibitor [Streptomyces chryseus]
MRRIRNTLGAVGAATALALTGAATATPAHAEPAGTTSLYAPSAIVLTVGTGEEAGTATVARAVTLSCAPTSNGTHPSPEAACAELRAAGGEFSGLVDTSPQRICTREWDPVVITAQGVWQGKPVSWSTTFGNTCLMEAGLAEGALFAF